VAFATGAPSAEKSAEANEKITSLLTLARTKLDEGRIAEAHLLLSPLCREPGAPPELMRLLDQMAGVVIYSRQHLLESPYQVQPGDTLERIADALHVPALLLARINGLRESESLRPGRELKVVRGPFSAVIDLGKSELTLMLRDRYAGRFPVSFIPAGHLEGIYTVLYKRVNPDRGAPTAGAANASATSYWIDLGGIGISSNRELSNASPGSISLGDRDIDDVYGILSIGSRVTIRR
jgi:LysM repeat protein